MDVKTLENKIKEYAQAYYSGESVVSDDYFDSLVDQLRSLNPDSDVLKKTGWGYEPSSNKRKVQHKYGLNIGSLPKYKEVNDIPSVLKKATTRISAKLDGLSVVSYYVAGYRTLALTRGTNNVGIDVTDKIDFISPETKEINSCFTGAIRGEVVLPNSIWNTDKYQKIQEENPSANQRNVASGYMNRDNLFDDLKDLQYVCYKILKSVVNEDGSSIQFGNIHEMHEFLSYHDFITVPFIYMEDLLILTEEELKNLYNIFAKEYPCDGLVFTEYTDMTFANEIAFKFEAESKEVTVKKITWNATRTGRVVPLVWFDPVNLSGAMVQKATAFNAKFIKDNKINVGTVLKVSRSGEVIPDIKEVVRPSEEGYLIDKCPHCGNDLVWNGVDLYCSNENENQLAQYFISTVAPLDGAGYSLYQSIVDLFELQDIQKLCAFLDYNRKDTWIRNMIINKVSGEVTKEKCCKILDLLKSDIDPELFLLGCNIKGLGETNIKTILDQYPNIIQDIVKDSLDTNKLLNIKGIGESLIDSIKNSIDKIQMLEAVCSISEYQTKESVDTQFKVAITGSLSMKRADFDKLLQDKGIEQSGSFKEIKYLITNNLNSTSSKMKNAIANGVEIISEEEFTKMYL